MAWPWLFGFAERIHKTESSDTSEVFIRRKKSTVPVDRQIGRPRERVTPPWWFESLLWDISSRFPLTSHLALPGSESVFSIYLRRILLCVPAHLLGKMDSTEEAYG